jgi:hypothetical protein
MEVAMPGKHAMHTTKDRKTPTAGAAMRFATVILTLGGKLRLRGRDSAGLYTGERGDTLGEFVRDTTGVWSEAVVGMLWCAGRRGVRGGAWRASTRRGGLNHFAGEGAHL